MLTAPFDNSTERYHTKMKYTFLQLQILESGNQRIETSPLMEWLVTEQRAAAVIRRVLVYRQIQKSVTVGGNRCELLTRV